MNNNIIVFFFISYSVLSQQQIDIPVELFKEITTSKIEEEYLGSVYVFEDYKAGHIIFEEEKIPLKLNINAYSNLFSYIDNFGNKYELKSNLGLKILIDNKKYKYLKIEGRDIIATPILRSNDNLLFKSFYTKITPPRFSSNGYDLPKPGKIEIKTSFIFFIDDKYYLAKKNKKSVINAFPDHKDLIKKSKLRFKDEDDFYDLFNLF